VRIIVKAVGACKGLESANKGRDSACKGCEDAWEGRDSATGVYERASPFREMLLESVSVFLEAVIVLVSTAKVL
jgi:hypothetical protein